MASQVEGQWINHPVQTGDVQPEEKAKTLGDRGFFAFVDFYEQSGKSRQKYWENIKWSKGKSRYRSQKSASKKFVAE
jgi:hypothetical protein